MSDTSCLARPSATVTLKAEKAAIVIMIARMTPGLSFLIPLYRQDRTELNIAVGCTGGHHRSVAVAQALADALEQQGIAVSVTHRDKEL